LSRKGSTQARASNVPSPWKQVSVGPQMLWTTSSRTGLISRKKLAVKKVVDSPPQKLNL
jgi:hypothetical protein